jgi:hypothetical protein
MPPENNAPSLPSHILAHTAADDPIAQLVGKVYETAPMKERSRLLEYLLKPLSVLSLVAVANGVFAKYWFRSARHEVQLQLDDVPNVSTSDVVALAHYVQQVSMDALTGLVQFLANSPDMARTSAAALLITLLLQQAKTKQTGEETE